MDSSEKKKGMNPKYIQFFVVAVVFLGFMFFSSPGSGEDTRAYSLRGYEGGFVGLYNGIIIATAHDIRFLPGILIASNLERASGVSVEFFFSDEYGNIRSIYQSATYMPAGAETGARTLWLPLSQTPINIGEFREDLDNIITSLHCEVVVTFVDGTVRESVFYLNAADVLAGDIDL